jgi:uncharacterized protein (TIGR03067 family)
MTRLLTLTLLLVTASFALADDKKPADKKPADAKAADKKLDPAKLVGEWSLVSGMKAGKKSDEEALKGTVKVTKDQITLANMGFKFVFSYKLDATKDPVAIDMETLEPETLKGGKAPGIIKLDGDSITLCYNPAKETRPTKFESTEENGNFLFVMKKKDAKQEKKDK